MAEHQPTSDLKEAVLSWILVRDSGAAAWVDQHMPDATPEERKRAIQKIRQWLFREREKHGTNPRKNKTTESGAVVHLEPPPPVVPIPDPRLPRREYLEAQVDYLAWLIGQKVNEYGWAGQIPKMLAQAADANEELSKLHREEHERKAIRRLSPERRREALEGKAMTMPLPELEIFVRAYCARAGATVTPKE